MDQKENLKALYIQEQDRKRIARDLHDVSLQNLAHLAHKLELAGMMMDKDPVGAKLELHIINKKLHEVIDDIRDIIFDLRPMTFDDLGFRESVERLLSVINAEGQYEIDADLSDVSCENDLILMNIFRIIQEILNNIVEHAEAHRIVIRCFQEDHTCHIFLSDDGVGFDEEDLENMEGKHFGISIIRERVNLLRGELLIRSHAGEGTQIQIKIPL